MFVEFRKMILELSYTKELKKTAQYTNKQAMLMALMKVLIYPLVSSSRS